eukprot:358752-Chlamydomonas_euryale.AAC.23
MRARRNRYGRNGDAVPGVQLSGELFEHADHGMCWIMASVVGDDACCTIGCTEGKVHVALLDAWSSNCKLMGMQSMMTSGLWKVESELAIVVVIGVDEMAAQMFTCDAATRFWQESTEVWRGEILEVL